MGTGELLEKPNKLKESNLRWTSIPSRGSRNTPSPFVLQKPEKAPAAMSLQGFIFFPRGDGRKEQIIHKCLPIHN